jgi:hypothetical protein
MHIRFINRNAMTGLVLEHVTSWDWFGTGTADTDEPALHIYTTSGNTTYLYGDVAARVYQLLYSRSLDITPDITPEGNPKYENEGKQLDWLSDEDCRAILATQTMLVSRLQGCEPGDELDEANRWDERDQLLWNIGFGVSNGMLESIDSQGGLAGCFVVGLKGLCIIDTQFPQEGQLTNEERTNLFAAIKQILQERLGEE